MKSAKKIGSGAQESINKALSSIGSVKPDMKDDSGLKEAVAPKKAPSFGEAFKAARAAGDKTFTFGGKSFTTKMAGEGAKRPVTASAPTKKVEAPKATAGVSASTRSFMSKLPTAPKAQSATPAKPAATNKPAASTPAKSQRPNSVVTGRERLSQFFSGIRAREKEIGEKAKTATDRTAERKRVAGQTGAAMLAERQRKISEAGKKQVRKVEGNKRYAKGGSIDGCAIRGKTRAPMKKGK